ncbi:hypothetical protein Baya_11785 [Bagarius yarrelli]|uniref:Uncharacterized protein n=1 Tax=Bagarius yarrelli TaxID=175774 RepID=A0A556V157_BAGYA|nr:hypothetical protein Baya_11785 [Bagarius yarrelli]
MREKVIGVMGLKPRRYVKALDPGDSVRAGETSMPPVSWLRRRSHGQLMNFGPEIPEWTGPTLCEFSGGDADILPFGAWKKEVKIELKIEEQKGTRVKRKTLKKDNVGGLKKEEDDLEEMKRCKHEGEDSRSDPGSDINRVDDKTETKLKATDKTSSS